MGIIRNKIKIAFDEFLEDDDLEKFVFALVDVADYHVHYEWQRGKLNDALHEEFAQMQLHQDEVIEIENES